MRDLLRFAHHLACGVPLGGPGLDLLVGWPGKTLPSLHDAARELSLDAWCHMRHMVFSSYLCYGTMVEKGVT